MKLAEKLPKKIKSNIVKASTLEKEWEKNTLCSTLNECINIENNIKEINTLTEKIKDVNANENIQMKFNIKDNEIKDILDKIKSLGTISDNLLYKFKFKEGLNYTISNNGLIATKTSGGDFWNCTVIGDKEIPKNKISKWKIKINNFKIKNNSWNILIGVGPKNVNNEDNHNYKFNNMQRQDTYNPFMDDAYIENVLKNNRGMKVEVHVSLPGSNELQDKVFAGIIEQTGKDHLIISSPKDGEWNIIPLIYITFITFEEPIKYN